MNPVKRGAPPRYDAAFKEGAVKLVIEQSRPIREVANELGIGPDTLRSWLKLAGIDPQATSRSSKDAKRIRELEAQVKALKKQTTEKDEVIEVLKKSSVVLLRKTALCAPAFLRVHVGILSSP